MQHCLSPYLCNPIMMSVSVYIEGITEFANHCKWLAVSEYKISKLHNVAVGLLDEVDSMWWKDTISWKVNIRRVQQAFRVANVEYKKCSNIATVVIIADECISYYVTVLAVDGLKPCKCWVILWCCTHFWKLLIMEVRLLMVGVSGWRRISEQQLIKYQKWLTG